jgi:ankyrin repeat protein
MTRPQEALTQAIHCGNEEAVRHAIREGADVNLPDINGLPPLLLAYQLGQFAVARLLVDNGADLQRACPEGCTALMAMTKLGKTDEVEFLLKNKANPNSSDTKGTTPLHVAAMRLNIRLIAALMNAGGDPHLENQRGVTPISMAKRNGKKGLANVMESLWGRPAKDLAMTVLKHRKTVSATHTHLNRLPLESGVSLARPAGRA